MTGEKITQLQFNLTGTSTAKQTQNKTGTSQVGAISKSQKAQNIFLEKT